jgi:NDP-sugar pyrophosphorylase family protein
MENTDVLILCGGFGKRLRQAVSDRPKPMAKVNQRPFLDIVINHFRNFGLKRFILCTGYMSDCIEDYYQNRKDKDISLFISYEQSPLGTAGAIANARELIITDPFFVTNGDSFCDVDIDKMADFHSDKNSSATVAVTDVDTSDCGKVKMDKNQKIIDFNEKNPAVKFGYVNTGIYLFSKTILSALPENKKYSLEYDVFPKLQNCHGYVTHSRIYDIGTPQKLADAEKMIQAKTDK